MELKNEIHEFYKKYDLEILPQQIKTLIDIGDQKSLIKLKKLMPAFKYYEKFSLSYKKAIRSVNIEDSNDLIAYMIKNSNIVNVEMTDEIKFSMDILNQETDHKTMMKKFIEKKISSSLSFMEKIYESALYRLKSEVEDYYQKIGRLINFEKKYHLELSSSIKFIDLEFNYSRKELKFFYELLNLDEKLSLVDYLEIEDYCDIDSMGKKSNTFFIILRNLNQDMILPKGIYMRHPYLIATQNNIIDIIESCLSGLFVLTDNEIEKRIRAFASMKSEKREKSAIKDMEKKIKEKCLNMLKQMKNTTNDLISGDYFKNGMSL